MSDSEPIVFRPRQAGNAHPGLASSQVAVHPTAEAFFHRRELSEILAVYGRMVAAGEWRDYAIEMGREKAVFSVYRRASEWPLFRIEKHPRLARKQGTYSVIAATGAVLKRGHELKRVLSVLERNLRLVVEH